MRKSRLSPLSRRQCVLVAFAASVLSAALTHQTHTRVRRDASPQRPWPKCLGATVELNEMLALPPFDPSFSARVWNHDAPSMLLLANLADQCRGRIERPNGEYHVWTIPFQEGFTGFGWPFITKRPETRVHIQPHFRSVQGYTIVRATFDGKRGIDYAALVANWFIFSSFMFPALLFGAVVIQRRRLRALRARVGFPVLPDHSGG